MINFDYTKGRKFVNVQTSLATKVKPRVLIPIATEQEANCDIIQKFMRAGAQVRTVLVQGEASTKRLLQELSDVKIVVFSDILEEKLELFYKIFYSAEILGEVKDLLNERDGLIWGYGNGFRLLEKLNLLPVGNRAIQVESKGEVSEILVRVTSNLSPWLMDCKVGESYITKTRKHAEFIAENSKLENLGRNGQLAAQYTQDNVTEWGIESLTSADGRVLGQIGKGEDVYLMKIIMGGLRYYL